MNAPLSRNLALLLAMTRIDQWESSDKQLTAHIIGAKGSGVEALYLKLMQKHSPLRACRDSAGILMFGSGRRDHTT